MANTSLPVIARALTSSCGSEMNESTAYACRVSFWLIRTCPFLLLTVGTIGNTLNLIVLSRPEIRKQPTTILLLFLAFSDMLTLWNSLVRTTFMRGWAIEIRNRSAFICAVQEFQGYCTATFSNWLLAAISMERMLLTIYPARSRTAITRRRAVMLALALLAFSLLLTIHLPFGKTFQKVRNTTKFSDSEEGAFTCTYVSTAYLSFYQNIWSVMILALSITIPSLIVLCCNIVIGRALFLQRKRIAPPGGNNLTMSLQLQEARRRALTRTILFISVFFLVTMTPYPIYLIIISRLPNDVSEETMSNVSLGLLIVLYTGMLNYSLNFFFYFTSGPLFKRELKKCLKDALQKLPNWFERNGRARNPNQSLNQVMPMGQLL